MSEPVSSGTIWRRVIPVWLGLMALFVFFYLLEWAPPGMGRISLMLTPPPGVTGSYALDALIAGAVAGSLLLDPELVRGSVFAHTASDRPPSGFLHS